METLYTEEMISKAIEEIAPQIIDKIGSSFTLVPILTGGFILAADLCRAMYKKGADPEVDFLQLSSYGASRESSGSVRVVKDLSAPVEGQTVLLVDDVLDSGRSLRFAHALMRSRGAAQIFTCVAVAKEKLRPEPIEVDFALFRTEGEAFLVGYGMDDAGSCRAMPEIGIVGD